MEFMQVSKTRKDMKELMDNEKMVANGVELLFKVVIA